MKENDSSSQDLWAALKDYPRYEINRNGQVRNPKTGQVLKIQYNRYRRGYVTLFDEDGVARAPFIDQLVADTFLHKPEGNDEVILVHLDGNNENSSVENIAWNEDNTAEEEFFSRTGLRKPKEFFVFYPLMEYPGCVYEINKAGQLRNKRTHNLMKGAIRDGGYMAYSLYINKSYKMRYAHILVAKQFIPNPDNKPLVNHIDENKANPCVDNLEWVTATENLLHGSCQEKSNLGKSKPINEYTIDGKYVRTWLSMRSLSNFFDTIYPNFKNYPSIKSVMGYNTRDLPDKKVFANRIFVRYSGNCDDQQFQIHESNLKKYKNHTLDGVEVPKEYLFDASAIDYVAILREIQTLKGINRFQREAIDYAIDCISKCKKNELVIESISSIITDHRAT